MLQEKLDEIESRLVYYMDLAASYAKWLEYGVHIQYYSEKFIERMGNVEELRQNRDQLRSAISRLQGQ